MKTLPSVRSVIYNILTFWWFDAALSQALCSVCSLEVITIFSKRSTFGFDFNRDRVVFGKCIMHSMVKKSLLFDSALRVLR